MVGWVTLSRVAYVLKNKLEVKFPLATTRACLVVDSDKAGTIYYTVSGEVQIVTNFRSEDELDELLDDLQNNRKEFKFDEETKKFTIVKTNVLPESFRSQDKTDKQGSLHNKSGNSNLGDDLFA